MRKELIQASVDRAFKGKTEEEFGLKYLELLLANWTELAKALRRAVFFSVLTILAFLLLDHAKDSEFSIGPLRTDNVTAVLVILPAATSYFLFEAIDLTLAGSYYRDVTRSMMQKLYPSVVENNLEMLLMPGTTFAWGAGFEANLAPRGRSKVGIARLLMGGLVILAIVFSTIFFMGYAYVCLYENDQIGWLAVTASLVFALFNVIRAALHVIEDYSKS